MKSGLVILFATLLASAALQDGGYDPLIAKAKLSASDAIARALEAAGSGTVVEVELELDKGTVAWSIDIAQEKKVFAIAFDAESGKVFEQEVDDEDRSADAAGAALGASKAMAAAAKSSGGTAVHARRSVANDVPSWTVGVWKDGKLASVTVGADGGVKSSAGASNDQPFTDAFGEEAADLGPTGSNPWFILEPGYRLELAGEEDGKPMTIIITVLDETRVIDGVTTRVVEERETKGDRLAEITRDYFAISRRTNNVYYFGEDVDEYGEDGTVTHGGSWLSGKDGARYGLMMPGVALLGARFQQETAPGVAMDRCEIISIRESYTTPVGTFQNVLVTEETTPLESGKEKKRYARGIGLLQDGETKLVKHGRAK